MKSGCEHLSIRLIARCLNKNEYKYRQAKKGLLSRQDKMLQTFIAKNIMRLLRVNFWQSGNGIYLDGVSFAHKTNPHAEVRAAGTMTLCKAQQRTLP